MYEDIQRFRQDLLNEAEIVSGHLETVGLAMPKTGNRLQIPQRFETYKGKPVKVLEKIFGSK